MFYDAANALLTEIRACMGGESCPYQLFVSRGMPPADCNSIVARYDGGRRNDRESNDCDSVFEEEIVVTLTKCCVTPDIQTNWNPVLEDAEAKCFYDDLALLRQCLICNGMTALEPYVDGCKPYVTATVLDPMSEGGCFSGSIVIRFRNVDCCPAPPPTPFP